jgi:hypothetical protein
MNYLSLKPFHKLLLALILLGATVFAALAQPTANPFSHDQAGAQRTTGRCTWGSGSCIN